MDRPQLVDGRGAVLIDGADPTTSSSLTINRGQKVTALVNASNYCGTAPVPPVTVDFVLSDGRKIKAAPLSPADATVPPCNGAGLAGPHRNEALVPMNRLLSRSGLLATTVTAVLIATACGAPASLTGVVRRGLFIGDGVGGPGRRGGVAGVFGVPCRRDRVRERYCDSVALAATTTSQ